MAEVLLRNRNAGKFYKSGEKKEPNWEYRFEVASVDGKRKQASKSGYATKKEAYKAGIEAFNQYHNTGRTPEKREISVADYLDYWLEHAIKKNINQGYSYKTYVDYESKIRLHLKPAFGVYKLNAFQYNPAAIQSWIDDLKRSGFSRNMVKNCLSCLSTAMNYAILPLQYISVNPCMPVKIGKMMEIKESKGNSRHPDYICHREEFQRIIERFSDSTNFYLPLMLGYYLGTRIGETYGFNLLEDFDPQNGKITITHQLTKENGIWYYRPPKYNSCRTIETGEVIQKILQKEMEKRKENMLFYDRHYLKTYLLPDCSIAQMRADIPVPYAEIWPLSVRENGELLTPESFKYCARVIHEELGNPKFHSHCLRKTHGTILAENGINPRTVMERLGHKDIETTLQAYTFSTDVMNQNAIQIFEKSVQSFVHV